MASYDPVSPDYPVHRIPRKRVATDLVGLESPADEKHGYAPVSTNHVQPSDQDSQSTTLVRERSPFRWWSLEILSCLAAAGCLGAIIALLVIYDGQPQSKWNSNVLTLNGLVALLATLCRTFFMVGISAAIAQGKWNQLSGRNEGSGYRLRDFSLFDDAAKGPWGSLQLIWRFKGLHIACLGAALSILSLAFGLFSQQLIGLDTIQVSTGFPGTSGWVSRAPEVTSLAGFSTSQQLLSTTRLSIYNGFLASEIGVPQVNCPTGDCKWPVIPTMGVCGACINITDSIRVTNASAPRCFIETPAGVTTNGSCTNGGNALDTKFIVGPSSGELFSMIDDAPADSDAPNIIADFGALGITGAMSLESTLNESLAYECALWYCVQAHKVRVEGGEVRDDIVDIWSKVNGSAESLVSFVDIPESFNIDADESYRLGQYQIPTMRNYLKETMQGDVKVDGTLGVVWTSSEFVEGLFNAFDDVDAWIERLARSMSNEVRSLGNASSEVEARYRGEILSNEVIVVVRWLWLIYPAGMVLLAVVYLVFEATRTSLLRDVRAWKDDSTVPLCMDLDDRLKEAARTGLVEPKGARTIVGEHNVRVTRGENGFPKGFAVKED